MARPAHYRQRLQRIRILFLICCLIIASYLLIFHSDHAPIPGLKSFRFSSEFLDKYAYANDDALEMLLAEEEVARDEETSETTKQSLLAARRLIESGRGQCTKWTIPGDEDEVENRRDSSCWKDTHYRQIKAYLDKAEVNKTYRELSWHNDLVDSNLRSLQAVLDCLLYFGTKDMPDTCHDNMLAVIVSHSYWMDMALTDGSNAGEVVWLRTVVDTLRAENTTIVSLSHWNYKALVTLHNAMPDVITSVYAADFIVTSCLADPRCRSDFPPNTPEIEAVALDERGTVPSWKMLAVTYWGARPPNHAKSAKEFGNRPDDGFAFNPLGNEWTITPFPYPNHTYVPMTVEKSCTEIDVVPLRERTDEVTVLGKLFQYFYPHRTGAALPLEVWKSFEEETRLTPIANARTLKDDEVEQDTPEGLVNRGPVSVEAYNDQIAHSRAFLGVGRPDISPSPYLALCAGVPVILPYYGEKPVPEGWDLYHADLAQHGPAAAIGPPYVYSYHKDDVDALYAAVRSARDNPIDRYIPADMRYDHVRSEIIKLLNTDWLARSRRVEDAREARGEPRQGVVPSYVIETLFKNGAGRRIDEEGEVSKALPEVG